MNNNKKYLWGLSLLAISLAYACSSDDSTSDLRSQSQQGDYITLDVSAPSQELEDTTRGSVITTSNIADMRLTGMKYLNTSNIDATTPAQFFYNQEVTKASGWKTAYCWPGNKEKVQLFAFAPSAALAATEGGEGITWSSATKVGVPTFSYKLPSVATNQQDLLVSSTGVLDGNSGTAVALNFSHVLAKVVVRLGSTGMMSGTITKISFKNVNTTGTYTYGSGWGSTIGTLGDVSQTMNFATNGQTNTDVTTGTSIFMMLPQQTNNVVLEVVKDGVTYTKNLNVNWEAGKTYSYSATSTVQDYSCTCSVQTFRAPVAGTYKLQVWGASGRGDTNQNNGSHRGLGGYSEGNVHLSKGQVLYVFVGGEGGAHGRNGGYNGGGDGRNGNGSGTYTFETPGAAGGGMTHISTTNNPAPELATGTWSTAGTIIVAGGGGGADDADGGTVGGGNDGSGGHGGGTSGGEPRDNGTVLSGYAGTNSSGYKQGRGADGSTTASWEAAGGGGGWWGGKATSSPSGGAGGGSGYIGGVINNTGTTIGGGTTAQQMPAPGGGTEYGHAGDGYCRISLISIDQ